MERQINFKYLMNEVLRQWKLGVIVGIIFALLLGGKAWMDGNRPLDGTYASYGKLMIEKNADNIVVVKGLEALVDDEEVDEEVFSRTEDAISDMLETQDNSEKYMSLLTSDIVLTAVEEDVEVKQENLSVESIRDMLYLTALDNGNIIEINIVGSEEKTVQLICEKLMKYGREYFQNNNYTVEIIQDATKLGFVTVESKEDTSDPRNEFVIIKPVGTASSSSVSNIAKNILMGFIVGVMIWCVILFLWFIIRNRIAYADQIEEEIGMNLLGRSSQENIYGNLYSNLFFRKSTLGPVAFASIRLVKSYDEFIEGFIGMLSNADKIVLLVEYVRELGGDDELVIESRNGYAYAGINDAILIKHNGVESVLDTVSADYDLILIKCGDINVNPMAKLVGSYADESVFLVEPDTVRVRDMISVKESFIEAGEKIAGVVWMEPMKKSG